MPSVEGTRRLSKQDREQRIFYRALVKDTKARFNRTAVIILESGRVDSFNIFDAATVAANATGKSGEELFNAAANHASISPDEMNELWGGVEINGQDWQDTRKDLAIKIVDAEIRLRYPNYRRRDERRDFIHADASQYDIDLL